MASNKRITLQQLPDAINDILKEYGENITKNIPEITERVGKEGVKALKDESRSKFNGEKYWKGWRLQTEHERLRSGFTIYNAKLPGLPHLLEHGHAKRNGGRVEGRAHIAPVEQKLIAEYERKIINDLSRNS